MSTSRAATAVLLALTSALAACGAPPDDAASRAEAEPTGSASQAMCIPAIYPEATGVIPDEPGILSMSAPSDYATSQKCTNRFIADATPGWTRPPSFMYAADYVTAPQVDWACNATYVDASLYGLTTAGTWVTIGTAHAQMAWMATHHACSNTMVTITVPQADIAKYTLFRQEARAYTNTPWGVASEPVRSTFAVFN